MTTYNKASLLIDSLRINTSYLAKLEQAKRTRDPMATEEPYWRQTLVQHGKDLKIEDKELKEDTAILFTQIDTYLRNHAVGA